MRLTVLCMLLLLSMMAHAAEDESSPSDSASITFGGLIDSVGSLLDGSNTSSENAPEEPSPQSQSTGFNQDSIPVPGQAETSASKDTPVTSFDRDAFVKAALSLHYGEAAELMLAAGVDYRDFDDADLHLVCQTWLTVRHYSNLQGCLSKFESALQRNNYVEMTSGTTFSARWNRAMGDFYLSSWRAVQALDLGEQDEAIRQAQIGVDILRSNKIDVDSSSLLSLVGGFRGDMAAYMGQEVYGVLAVGHAYRGEMQASRDALNMLRSLSNQRYTAEFALHYWLALAYFARQDYEAALKSTELRERDSLDSIDSASRTLITPITSVVGALLGTDMDAYTRFGQLEYEYIKAHSLFMLGRLDEARPRYDELLKLTEIINNGAIFYRMLQDRGQIAESDGNIELAIELYRKAVDVVEAQRSTIATESGKLGFASGRQGVYRDLIRLLIKQGKPELAFEYTERAKARALVDMLASRQELGSGNQPGALQYLQQLSAAEQPASLAMTDQHDSLRTRSVATQIKTKLKQVNPELASLVTVDAASMTEIRAMLGTKESLVEYYVDNDQLYAFVVSREQINAFKLDGNSLNQDVTIFRQAIRNSQPVEEMAKRLHSRLIAPLQSSLKGDSLLIVPHGVLHYLPFNALHDGKKWLIDNYALRLLPSASVLRFLDKKSVNDRHNLLVLGNPDVGDTRMNLPGAEQEAMQLSKLNQNSQVLLRRNATETVVREQGAVFKQLHFASHGQFNEAEPLNSRLLLAADSKNDGNLTVGEMYDLQLNADLVTLSACETGLGQISSGDDVVGLTRGFLYAGARSIVASLWEVADEPTAFMMVNFYTNLSRMNKGEALRQAQLAARKKYGHPLYWAAFQLTGSM